VGDSTMIEDTSLPQAHALETAAGESGAATMAAEKQVAPEETRIDAGLLPLSEAHRRAALASGLNPLVGAAHALIEAGAALRDARAAQPLEPLRARLAGMIETFGDETTSRGIDAETVALARYCLCTFIDETIAATSWGGGAWAARSLLVTFFGEASGGERFFTILHGLSQEPRRHLDALELLFVILSLGMAGRYRLMARGHAELERVRETLRRLIVAERGRARAPLSPQWQAAHAPLPRRRYVNGTALALSGVLVFLAALGAVFDHRLQEQAQPVIHSLRSVRLATAAPQPAAAPAVTETALRERLSALLAPEIASQRVTVGGTSDRAVITLLSDGVFASGRATVRPDDVPLIRRIGAALDGTADRVIVVGHTDDRPPLSSGQSNWQLSLARASSVVELLREEAGRPERFLAQGRGALDPIASNDSTAGRGRNRRVVITVLAPGAAL
jgi:type VI secretion system protein ImpK